MRFSLISAALLASLAIANAIAQDQTGRIEGMVVDAISHQPVKKATVSLNPIGRRFAAVSAGAGQAIMNGAHSEITDAAGSFAFPNLAAGTYQLNVMNQNYPGTLLGGKRKTVDVAAGDAAAQVTIELMPGAALSGHIVDEDGDPLAGCAVQPHAAKNLNRGVPMTRLELSGDDGSYRLSGIPAGKYIISVQCSMPVFQPRPLSAGPDPPPSAAYPPLYYSAARDVKSAQVVELSAGTEKSGVDFQMRPVAVTQIHGTFAGGVDWHGHGNMNVMLVPVEATGPRFFGFNGGAEMNADGSFDIRSVFPGSYQIVAVAQTGPGGLPTDATEEVGGVLRVDVADKPLSVSLQLHQAMDISGKVTIEGDNNSRFPITPAQINLQLLPTQQIGFGTPVTQPNADGNFTFKSVLPGDFRISISAPRAFLKSARMGSDDVTDRPLNLTSGAGGTLQIVVSTNTGTLQGTAPAGEQVFAQAIIEDVPFQGWRGTQVDANGQFKLEGLAPGKYRVAVGENDGVMPDGGQEVTITEGETATIDLKAEETKAEAQP